MFLVIYLIKISVKMLCGKFMKYNDTKDIDDVVLCAREKDVLELELEQWRIALEKREMNVSRAKTELCLNGTPLVSVKMHRSPNSNIWEAPCRTMVTRVQI